MDVSLSLLDRLTDLEPNNKREAKSTPWEDMRELKASVCRDLASLLNTRRAEQDFDPDFVEAANSVLTFGVADFTSFNLKNGIEQEKVRRSIERAVRQFEPRLARVIVTLEPPGELQPLLRFQIEAMLRAGADTEPVLFDATLHRDTRRFNVAGARS